MHNNDLSALSEFELIGSGNGADATISADLTQYSVLRIYIKHTTLRYSIVVSPSEIELDSSTQILKTGHYLKSDDNGGCLLYITASNIILKYVFQGSSNVTSSSSFTVYGCHK